MIKILICLDDDPTVDVIKTAFRQFEGMSTLPVSRNTLMERLLEPGFSVVVLDLRTAGGESLIAEVRELNDSIEIVAVTDQKKRSNVNRLKVEHGIGSSMEIPIDPFRLARSIVLLRDRLVAKHPATA